VTAVDNTGELAAFSNYGKWVTLSAPGAMIMSTARGGGYSYWNGTSFASPIAAGVAALVVSVNPALTAPQVVDILKQSADDLGARGYDIFYGWGRVNAARAVEAALATLPASTPADAAAAADSAPEQPIETNSPEVLP
jgi:subtilisin family serine protease